MATQCDVELGKVAVCVSSDAACTCITSPEDFQEQVTQGARQTVAFYNPGTPEYCDGANDNICDYISTSASCCCSKEVESYAQCFFNKEIANFGATDCPYVGGCTSSDDGGGGSLLIIIISVVTGLLCCCGGYFFWRRRRNRLADFESKFKTFSDSEESDYDIESRGYVRKRKGKKKGKWRGDESDSDVSDASEEPRKMKKKKGGNDSDSSESDDSDNRKKKKKTKGKKKRRYESELDESSDDDYRRGRGKINKKKNRKGFDSDSDESDDSGFSRRRKKGRQRNNYSDSDDDDSVTRRNRRDTRSKLSRYSDDDDSVTRRNRREKRRPLHRAGSKYSRYSDDDLDEDSVSRRYRKERNGGRRRNSFNDDDFIPTRPSTRPQARTVEESVRQARSILQTVQKSAAEGNGVTTEAQQEMSAEMSTLIAQLKQQKEEMEMKLKNSEAEAIKLRLEQEASKKHIEELETKKIETEKNLADTKREANNLQVDQTLDAANREAAKIVASAELGRVRKESEEMAKIIKKLEKAKASMAQKLQVAESEADLLRAENTKKALKIDEVEKDRAELKKKLDRITRTRSDLEGRLRAADQEAKRLRTLRTEKSRDIREERASTHVRKSYLNEMEADRKGINANLERIEKEREQMKTMMKKLESNQNRLTTLIEGGREANEDASLSLEEVFDLPDIVRQQQKLQTMLSPRQLKPTLSAGNINLSMAHPLTQEQPYMQHMGAPLSDFSPSTITEENELGMRRISSGGSLRDLNEPGMRRVLSGGSLRDLNEPAMRRVLSGGSLRDFNAPLMRRVLSGGSLRDVNLRQDDDTRNLAWAPLTDHRWRNNSRRRDQLSYSDHDLRTLDTNSSAGWLGNSIMTQSFRDVSAGVDPSVRKSRSTKTGGNIRTESDAIRRKREKKRRSERDLRSKMESSRSSSSGNL